MAIYFNFSQSRSKHHNIHLCLQKIETNKKKNPTQPTTIKLYWLQRLFQELVQSVFVSYKISAQHSVADYQSLQKLRCLNNIYLYFLKFIWERGETTQTVNFYSLQIIFFSFLITSAEIRYFTNLKPHFASFKCLSLVYSQQWLQMQPLTH